MQNRAKTDVKTPQLIYNNLQFLFAANGFLDSIWDKIPASFGVLRAYK